MLEIQSLGLFLGEQGLLLSDVNCRVGLNDKIGIVGRNGSGKSTLLNIIAGEISPDIGNVNLQPGKTMLLVKQQLPDDDITPLAFLEKSDAKLQSLYDDVDNAASSAVGPIYDEIDVIESHYKRSAGVILAGLGLSTTEQNQPMRNLSGGFRMRISIASALLQKPDYLLLDEPTNHLDPESNLWLMFYLKTYPNAILVVSHDVPFLNTVTDKTIHVKSAEVTLYRGNYDVFCREYELKTKLAIEGNEKRDKEIDKFQANINRFMSHPSRAGGCHAKEKLIVKLKAEQISLLPEKPIIPIDFPEPVTLGNPIIELTKASIGYGAKTILSNVTLSAQNDSRIVILGRNGQGKSTLVKALVGRIQPLSGEFKSNATLRTGYYSQDQTDELTVDASVYQEMKKVMPSGTNETIRAHLARFGFGCKITDQSVGELSGGEKARLIFAKISVTNPQLIIMDEPTNHLDIESKAELFKQIQAFKGAIIIVSHDWSLLEAAVSDRASQLWVVDSGVVKVSSNQSLAAYRSGLMQVMEKSFKQICPSGTNLQSFFVSNNTTTQSSSAAAAKASY